MLGRRLLCALRLELGLAGVAYAGLLCTTRPAQAAGVLGLAPCPWSDRLFQVGTGVALAALLCLALRLGSRLLGAGRHLRAQCVSRGVSGTVMVEFALVLPIVLLVMCLIAQLALLANASLVVRYAAFASARSAIVSFEADTAQGFLQQFKYSFAFPPFPEWVDKQRPELAAQLVLATLSPVSSSGDSDALALENVLRQQPGSVWATRRFEERMEYARAATRVLTTEDLHGGRGLFTKAHYESFSPAIQLSEHLIPPYRLSLGQQNFDLPLFQPLGSWVPTSLKVPLPKLSVPIKLNRFPPVQIPLQPPLPTQITVPIPPGVTQPIASLIDSTTQPLLTAVNSGSAVVLDAFAKTPANVDPMAPKEVQLKVEYDFLLNLPSLHFVPGLKLSNAPAGVGGKVVTLSHTLRLQSTGGRKSNLAALVPMPDSWMDKLGLESHGPLYWPWP